MTRKIYIAGAMSGIPYYNFPAFDAARDYWNSRYGWESVSPTDMDREQGIEPDENGNIENFDYRGALARCMAAVCECDAIYMLEGWEQSRGATAEFHLAIALQIDIVYQCIHCDQ